jgi:hypothetical protein
MNRRALLGMLAGAATGALILPELWVPKRKWFLPPRGGWPSADPTCYRIVGVQDEVTFEWIPVDEVTEYEIWRDGMLQQVIQSFTLPARLIDASGEMHTSMTLELQKVETEERRRNLVVVQL